MGAFCAANLFYFGLTDETPTGYAALRARIEKLENTTSHFLIPARKAEPAPVPQAPVDTEMRFPDGE